MFNVTPGLQKLCLLLLSATWEGSQVPVEFGKVTTHTGWWLPVGAMEGWNGKEPSPFATCLQGQLTACIQHPCCGAPCLGLLLQTLDLVEEAGLHFFQKESI